MSMPLYPQPPPAALLPQQSYSTHSTHGSIGPFIAVLVVVMILCILAGLIGRLCSGKTIMGYGEYDIESWAETKCSSCIDGRITPPPPLVPTRTRSDISESASVPDPSSVQTEEKNAPEAEQHSPPGAAPDMES